MPCTRRYRPGLLVFELGRLHRTQNDFVALAEQRLRAVCAQTGHTGYIAVLDGAEQVVLRVVPGSNPLQVVTPPGVRAPAFATSNGRAMLARLTDAEFARACQNHCLPSRRLAAEFDGADGTYRRNPPHRLFRSQQ